MSIGSRIRALRMKKGLTQKELGIILGFNERTAHVRIAQYEIDSRIPREDLLEHIANVLDVDVGFLNPDTRNPIGKMQLLFSLEDDQILQINTAYGVPILSFNVMNNTDEGQLFRIFFQQWSDMAEKLRRGNITREEYDHWRYNLE